MIRIIITAIAAWLIAGTIVVLVLDILISRYIGIPSLLSMVVGS